MLGLSTHWPMCHHYEIAHLDAALDSEDAEEADEEAEPTPVIA